MEWSSQTPFAGVGAASSHRGFDRPHSVALGAFGPVGPDPTRSVIGVGHDGGPGSWPHAQRVRTNEPNQDTSVTTHSWTIHPGGSSMIRGAIGTRRGNAPVPCFH